MRPSSLSDLPPVRFLKKLYMKSGQHRSDRTGDSLPTLDRNSPLLFPPDLRPWLPAHHRVHSILGAIATLDLRKLTFNYRGTVRPQHPPRMLRALLIQGFATGINIDAAVQKTGHHRGRSGLEQHPEPAAAPIASTGKLMRQRLRTSAGKRLYNAPANAATGVWDPQEREGIRASADCKGAGPIAGMDAGSARLQPQTAAPAGRGIETNASPLKPRGEETRAMEFTPCQRWKSRWERLAELPRRTEP
jgi:hypothetical protein